MANVAGGVGLAVVLLVLFPVSTTVLRHRVHPWALAKFVVFVLYSLVMSSWAVIKVIVRPTPTSLRAAVVRVRLEHESALTTTIVANAITLTPGTMTLTARLDPAEVNVHVLSFDDADEFRESVLDLERRTVAAFEPRLRRPGRDRRRGGLVNVVSGVVLALLAIASILCVVRALLPGTIIDRAIALDGVVSAIICGVSVAAVRTGNSTFIDIALVGGLLGFLTLSTVARYVGRRGL